MNNELMCTETLAILLIIGNKYINAIPQNVRNFIYENANIDRLPYVDPNKSINEQNISKETKTFITFLKLKYWSNSEKEKAEIIKLLKNNKKN